METKKSENQKGGRRPGAGRPKGSLSAAGKVRRMIWARPKDLSLVEFGLSIINDPDQPADIRAAMARQPFLSGRAHGAI
ncbi:hypothetical protein [Mesorhizobium sp. SP-1A]|uniref:hypothetical protein n=1 Tax=Mesorhizobium sp. SP-1A TaxID=3077840 RepID=UPI0028F73168|nr:hypothetical protein [Mesorhizobium sp. SP-1A]